VGWPASQPAEQPLGRDGEQNFGSPASVALSDKFPAIWLVLVHEIEELQIDISRR